MGEEFVCSLCGESFEKARSDDEAYAEARANFGNIPKQELAILCDDCFRVIMGR